MNIKQLLALLAALLLIYSLPVQAMAADAGTQDAGAESAGMDEDTGTEPDEATGSIFDLLSGSTVTLELDMAAYYLEEMGRAAVAGDTQAGREAEQYRNEIIDQNGSGEVKISFDDLYLLAKLICAEAGSDWLSDDFRLCVGEVVLNRVESPEFPDSISDVVYQKGQYASAGTAAFASLGKRVIQIGCDPKADSTINLLGGKPLKPVMNYMREQDQDPESIEEISRVGFGGVL